MAVAMVGAVRDLLPGKHPGIAAVAAPVMLAQELDSVRGCRTIGVGTQDKMRERVVVREAASSDEVLRHPIENGTVIKHLIDETAVFVVDAPWVIEPDDFGDMPLEKGGAAEF